MKIATTASRPVLLRAWWPAAVWVGLIAFESTSMLSAENTSSMLYSLLVRFFGEINLESFLVYHHYLRKTGHVLGYGILCLLLLRGWRATLDQGDNELSRTALLAWLGTVFVATMDEWHQSYLPSRTGSWQDVVLDSTAGLVFVLVAYVRVKQAADL